jgi:YgiT-type zinc finger domain-containing protein
MKDSLCPICSGKLQAKKTTIDRMVNEHLYLFEDVSVLSCKQCGEIWIPGKTAEKMELAIQGKLQPKRSIPVPVY